MSGKKGKGGRPRAKVDTSLVEHLAALSCSWEEIAAGVGVSTSTLEREDCREAVRRGRAKMKTSLRRAQMEQAVGRPAEYDADGNLIRAEVSPNTTMQIWLGKQHLSQREPAREIYVEPDKGAAVEPEGKVRIILPATGREAGVIPIDEKRLRNGTG